MGALKNGYRVIDSTYTAYYLDCGFANWLSGANSWCDPYKSWLAVYNHSVTQGIPAEYAQGILGGEVCLWGESVDDNNLEPRLWPRAAAGAERWGRDEPIDADEIDELFHRMAVMRDWMVWRGVVASPVQPEFCTLYPAYCDYYRDAILDRSLRSQKGWQAKLREHGLGAFVAAFVAQGWDVMQYWNEMTMEDAAAM